MMEELSDIRHAQNISKPVAFNGLLTNKVLRALPASDFARLLPHLEPVSLSCGENLYGFSESTHFIYFPETVVISQLYLLEDGSMVEAALIGKEGLTGLCSILSAPKPPYLTLVTVSGSAFKVRMEVIRQEFLRGEALQQLVLKYAGARIAQLSQRAVCNGRHTVDERLCSWLLMIQDRAGDEHQLPLTQEQIARHLGTRRAGITGAANALRDKQVISYSRGDIRILDRAALEAAACECYKMLGRQSLLMSQS